MLREEGKKISPGRAEVRNLVGRDTDSLKSEGEKITNKKKTGDVKAVTHQQPPSRPQIQPTAHSSPDRPQAMGPLESPPPSPVFFAEDDIGWCGIYIGHFGSAALALSPPGFLCTPSLPEEGQREKQRP